MTIARFPQGSVTGATRMDKANKRMNFYRHHIGDFDRATRHLTRIERSIYRDLMDVYYDTEAPLTLDMPALCRKVLARSNEEATAVEQVLNEFFTKTPSGWYHDRCEEEMDTYRATKTQKAEAGKASAAKRATRRQQAMNGNPTAVPTPVGTPVGTAVERACNGTPTNQKPVTNNQEPVNPVAQPTLSEDCARAATHVDLSIALRKRGVNCQSADPRLLVLAAQGVNVDTAEAACDEARRSKPAPQVIALGYVVSIIGRWAAEAGAIAAAGATPPSRASPGGYESTKDRDRRETLAGLTGSGHEPAPQLIDIN